MTQIINFIMWSSVNRAEFSLTLRGILLGIIPALSVAFQLTGVVVDQDFFSLLVDSVIETTTYFLAAVSGVLTVAGLVRKVVRTYQGKNDALK